MSFFTIVRTHVGSLLTPIKTQYNTSRQVKIFKGIRGIKCNTFIPTREQPAVRFRKGNYRSICLSSLPLGPIYHKSIPDLGATLKSIDALRFNVGYFIMPIVRCTSFLSMAKAPTGPFAGNWRLYTQAKEPGSPASSKGGPVKSSGGGVGKLDAANESGFFHKVNKARLNQIKQMLNDKAMLKGTVEDDEKKDPK